MSLNAAAPAVMFYVKEDSIAVDDIFLEGHSAELHLQGNFRIVEPFYKVCVPILCWVSGLL